MKLVNYKLQSQIEYLSENKPTNHFKEYLQAILEDSSKTYFQKCDYVGLSLNEIKNKIDSLSNDIKELQALKKSLSDALEIAKQLTAQIFIENGIDRVDGNIISSLTISKESTKVKEDIKIKDENAIMNLGYVKFSVDIEAIKEALKDKQAKEELKDLVDVATITTTIPAKVKINTKRNSSNKSQADEILLEVA